MLRLIQGEWLEWGAVTARLCVKHASVGGLGVCLSWYGFESGAI